MKEPTRRKPRFKAGDKVRIVGPSAGGRNHDTGEVTEVISGGAGTVLRYRVEFADGASGTFFGFELEAIEP